MYQLTHAGRHVSKTVGYWWRRIAPAAVLLVLACPWSPARANCLENPDPEIHQLQEHVSIDATKSQKQAQSLLPASSGSASRTAALYALEAQAYRIHVFDADTRAMTA